MTTPAAKIQRHEARAPSSPPSDGPKTIPAEMTAPLIPSARPRSPAGKTSVTIASPSAVKAAEPTPCTVRKAMRVATSGASAQAREPRP